MKHTIKPTDTIKITYIKINRYHDGSTCHSKCSEETFSGNEMKSIAAIGRYIYGVLIENKQRFSRPWSYIRIFNETQNWCEDYNISKFGNMSVKR